MNEKHLLFLTALQSLMKEHGVTEIGAIHGAIMVVSLPDGSAFDLRGISQTDWYGYEDTPDQGGPRSDS